MGRHHAVATSHNRRDRLDIITTLRISLAIPGPAVALIDCDFCIQGRIDGQVEGHHAIATIHSLQGSGIVTRGGEDLSIPLILDTGGGGEILHIGRINHCGGTCHNADAVGRIVSIHCIESSGLSNRIGHGAACSDIVRQCGILIPGSCCASYDISSQGCIAGTADIVARQNRRVRQGVHNYLHRGGRTFALSSLVDIGRLIRCICLNRRRSIAITLGKLLVVGIVPSDSASGSRSGCQHRTTLSTDSCRCRDCRGCRDFVNSHHQLSQITVALVLIGGHHVEGCSLRNLQGGAVELLRASSIAIPRHRIIGSSCQGHRRRTAMRNRGHLRSNRQLVKRCDYRSLGTFATRFSIIGSHLEGSGCINSSSIITRCCSEKCIVVIPSILNIIGISNNKSDITGAATGHSAENRSVRQLIDNNIHRHFRTLTTIGTYGRNIECGAGGHTSTIGIMGLSSHGGVIPLCVCAALACACGKGNSHEIARQTLRSGSRHCRHFRNIKNRNSQ